MTRVPVLVDLDPANLDTLPCCGVLNAAHQGRCNKNRWLRTHFKKGLRAKVLLTPDRRQCGYIEYLPGEYAWRGVDAAGYLFIHCVWIFRKEYRRQGFGGLMIRSCLADAEEAGMHGVAAVAREQPWLAGPSLFLSNGFECVDTAPPGYRLLVRKLHPSAPNPSFKGNWEEKRKKYGHGLTIIRSGQCPYIAKFAGEIAQAAEHDYGIKPRIVELRSHREAQNAPAPYAVFAILHNGRILADHQVSRARFRNMMKKLPK